MITNSMNPGFGESASFFQNEGIQNQSVRLLIIDDDQEDRLLLTKTLEKTTLTCQVDESGTLAGGLELLQKNTYDAVLLDHQLPDATGAQIITTLSHDRISIPVIIVTGCGDELLATQLLKAGAYDYLPKDRLNPESLASAIRGAIMIFRAQQALEHQNHLLRESEERFRTLFEKSPDAIFVEDTDGTVLDVNPAGCRLHETTKDRLVGRNVLELVPEEARKEVRANFPKWFSDELKHSEGFSLTAGGRCIPVEINANRIEYMGRSAILLHVHDVTERTRMEQERRYLASRLLDIQEQERSKISFMLHDHVGQLLTLARLELGNAHGQTPEDDAALNAAGQRLDEMLKIVRNLAGALRPAILDDLGLDAALAALAEEVTEHSGIKVHFTRTGQHPQLDKDCDICLYRMLQESLTNVVRHSGAQHVHVRLDCLPDELHLSIEDDGKGLPDSTQALEKGIGLLGIRERASRCGGRLTIHSRPGQGTCVRMVLPVVQNQDRKDQAP